MSETEAALRERLETRREGGRCGALYPVVGRELNYAMCRLPGGHEGAHEAPCPTVPSALMQWDRSAVEYKAPPLSLYEAKWYD